MKWEPKYLDYTLSPYTGLTRESWIDAAKYMLEGCFSNLSDQNDPVLVPRTEMEITYPHKNVTGNAKVVEEMSQRLEGLARSFLIAAPLIHNEPEVEINGLRLKDYYKEHILRACTPGDIYFAGYYEDLQALMENRDPAKPFQQTVETCSMSICLDMCRTEIWDTYTSEEKAVIAKFISNYAHANTAPQNWRLFNMIDLAFLYKEGYEIDHNVMREHAQIMMHMYVGDGWYRDGHSFDYYSCWTYSIYGPIWSKWYGYEKEPYIAQKFEEYSNALMKNYGDFFDEDGYTNMWGRSNIYRNAATAAFMGNCMVEHPEIDCGLARRIASGTLMQFFCRDDFWRKGVPSMGFYRQFPPLVQAYSCAESPYWLGKAFFFLILPAEHPFWTEKENNGSWDKLQAKEVKETCLDGPALDFTNHKANGQTILRTGKVVRPKQDLHGMWNYSKLAYNSKYPWEAAPGEHLEAMQYVLEDLTAQQFERCNVTFWHGKREGVLYRRQFFDYQLGKESHWHQTLFLADFPVTYGLIRADKIRLCKTNIRLTLGSYGFPDNGTEVIVQEAENAKAIILKGHDHLGKEKQMAMTIYDGWDEIAIEHSIDTNPDSEKSIIIYAKTERKKQYGYDQFLLISQVITKESLEDFTQDELFPIAQIQYTDPEKKGGYGPITISLKNGKRYGICCEGLEENMSL